MSFIVNQLPRGASAVWLAQQAIKYNIPSATGVRPSTVPALAPYVPAVYKPVPVIAPPIYIQPPAPPPIVQQPEPQLFIVPIRPLTSGGSGTTPGALQEPQQAVQDGGCSRGGCGTTAPIKTVTPQPVTVDKGAMTRTTVPVVGNAAPGPSLLGTLLTIGGAFMTMRNLG